MKLKLPLSDTVAISFGLLVLIGYFTDQPLLRLLNEMFLQWAIILAAVALLVGVLHLLSVHWRKAFSAEKGSFYSALLALALVVTVAVTAYSGPKGQWSMWLFNYIQVPVESSLMAILTVVLALAAMRLLRRRLSVFSVVFLITILIMLLGTAPIFGVEIPGLHGPEGLRALVSQIPAVAGARGLLLGIALGTIATGLRVLIGVDRPYGG